MRIDLLNMLYAGTAIHFVLGFVYVAIDYFEWRAYILGYVIALTVVETFVAVRQIVIDKRFDRTLHVEPIKTPKRISKQDEDAMYDYFVICLRRGEKPGKRNWLGREVPGYPHVTINLADWRLLTRHARYDGYLKYGGRGIGYANLLHQPTTAKTSPS